MDVFFNDQISDRVVASFQGKREIPGLGGVYLIGADGRVYRKQLRAVHTRQGIERSVRLKERQPQALGRMGQCVCLYLEGRRQNLSIQFIRE